MSADFVPETRGADWERLSTLFEATMSLPPAQREAHLALVRTDEPALWADLVELVAVADDAGVFFEELSLDVIAPVFDAALASISGDADGDAPATVQPPTRIRHYDVHECLGAGGMGVVYRGWDTKLARDVALKFVSPDHLIDPLSRQRLQHEAQAASSLSDANVCAIHAIEDLADGGICVIMGYCAGGTLRDRLRNGPLAIDDALFVAMQVATGLASAHRNGIVHRDIKPANIGFDVTGNARILDFGIATRPGNGDEPRGTSLAGSVPYLSPEQLRGAHPDARADVWALGVTLFEMLCGARPFREQPNVSLAHQIRHAPPAAFVRADGVQLPPALTELVQRLLHKDPATRPGDAAAVLALLRDVQTSLSEPPSGATVAPTPVAPRVHGPSRSRVGALVLFGALVIIAGLVWRPGLRRDQQVASPESPLEVARTGAPLPTVAVLPFSIEGGPKVEFLRNGLVDLMTSAFDATGLVRGIDPNAVIGAASAPIAARYDSAAASVVAAQLGASRFVVGNVVGAGSTVTVRATLYRASGEESGRSSFVLNTLDDLTPAVDQLVYGLVASELRAPGDTVAGLAAKTTSSAPALRAYLDGERELRDARPAAALAFFQRAVALDSMFALAWYRLARAAKWSEVDSLNALATERAYSLHASLPVRLQDIVRGYYTVRFGNPQEAERLLERLTRDYPTDVDAWMLLGETRFQQNPYYGRSTGEATDNFRRVMALDPRNREVNVYLMDLAARANRLGELDTLFRMYFSPNSAGEQPGVRQTYIALHARRLLARNARAQSDARIDDPTAARIALRRLHGHERESGAARDYATVMSSAGAEAAIQLEGRLALSVLDAAAGRDSSSANELQEATRLDAPATLRHRALLALAPSPTTNPALLDSLRRALTTTRFGGTGGRDALNASELEHLRQYLIGSLSIRLRDWSGAETSRRQLLRTRNSSRLSRPLEAALRAQVAVAEGKYEEAVQAFASSVVPVPIGVRRRYPALEQHADRLAHADALRALERWDEAARWYAALRDGPAITALLYDAAARAGSEAVAARRAR